MSLTLAELAVGDRGRVAGFAAGDRDYRQRLLAMGLLPGTEFQLARIAPLGDPVEIRVRGSALSLRKAEAAVLRVERLSP
jgi:ferrous iron transport protein A